jgi:hypothetical protein
MLKFLEQDGDSIRFTGDILNVYIPKNYFESNIAVYNGNEVNTIAYFFFEVKSFAMEEKDEMGHIYTFKLPSRIVFEFDDKNSKTLNIKDTGEIQYDVLTMNRGSIFVKNINVEESGKNAGDFLNMLLYGRFLPLIPYEEIVKIFMENMSINKMDLGCQNIIYEMMIGELMRNKKNVKEPFRKAINKQNINSIDYKNINLKNIAFFNSTYTAIGFEDFNKAMITSTAKNINNEKEIISPVEKILKY